MKLVVELLAGDTRSACPRPLLDGVAITVPRPAKWRRYADVPAAALGLVGLLLLTTTLPLAGIIRPLFSDFPAARAFAEISRTIGDTLVYALTAGAIATAMGIWMALAAGRERRLKRVALAGIFLVLSLPPSLNALSVIELGTIAPSWLDPLLRSRFTVGSHSHCDFFRSRP